MLLRIYLAVGDVGLDMETSQNLLKPTTTAGLEVVSTVDLFYGC